MVEAEDPEECERLPLCASCCDGECGLLVKGRDSSSWNFSLLAMSKDIVGEFDHVSLYSFRGPSRRRCGGHTSSAKRAPANDS